MTGGKARQERPRESTRTIDDKVEQERTQNHQGNSQCTQSDCRKPNLRKPSTPLFPGGGGQSTAGLYNVRNRSRTHKLTQFITKVITNNIVPTAKIVWYSNVPCGVSPSDTWTM
jgi:hypothetical protein